jgi:hypothetical protein
MKRSNQRGVGNGLGAFLFLLAVSLADPAVSEEVPPPEAYDFKLTVQTDKTEYDINDTIWLEVILANVYRGKIHDPELPDHEGLEVLGVASRTSFTFVYGRLMRTKIVTYELSPLRAGTIRIPSITYPIRGKTHVSEPFDIVVTGDPGKKEERKILLPVEYQLNTISLPASLNSDEVVSEEAPNPVRRKDVFLFMRTDKERAFTQEAVRLFVYFCRTMDLWGDIEMIPPPFVGFFSESVEIPQEMESSVQKIFDRRYFVTVQEWTLYPVRDGVYRIDPYRTQLQVDPIYQSFEISSNPVTVRVDPLPPGGRPENFSGLVGRFSMESEMDKFETQVGEPVQLIVRLAGSGNLHMVQSLHAPALEDLEVYESAFLEEGEFISSLSRRVKQFEYLLLPKLAEPITLSPFTLSYFDPVDRQYKFLETPPYRLTATPGEQRTVPAAPAVQPKKPIVQKGEEIVHIKPKLFHMESERISSREYLVYTFALVGTPALFLGFAWGFARYRRMVSDPAGHRKRKAGPCARKKLRGVDPILRKGDQKEFYIQLDRIVREYLADRCDTLPASIDREFFLRLYPLNDGELGRRLRGFLHLCEVARFAHTAIGREEMGTHLRQAVQIISDLETDFSRLR